MITPKKKLPVFGVKLKQVFDQDPSDQELSSYRDPLSHPDFTARTPDLPQSLASAMSDLTDALMDRFLRHGFVRPSSDFDDLVSTSLPNPLPNRHPERSLRDDIASLLGSYILDSARYQMLSRMIKTSLSQETPVEAPVGAFKVSSFVDRSHPVCQSVVSLSWISSKPEISTTDVAVTPPSRDPVLGDRLVSGRSKKDVDHDGSIDFDEIVDSVMFNDHEIEQSAWCHCQTKT